MAAGGLQSQEVDAEKEDLRRQLAAVVRGIQWSYAIFWALSARQQGVLEWSMGYYNGDIKTRKTTQALEFKADRWGLQRSEQLRELYISLSAGDSNPCARRPSASLSPEDLTDLEWYYLVCMSFTFSHGQGLPGRSLSGGSHLWLCNAHFADSKSFSRSLLAKSAYIQTVACFPMMGGVLELGTTELVLEDSNLVKQLTDSFWNFPRSICSEQSVSNSLNLDENDDQVPPYVVQQILNDNSLENFDSPANVPIIPSYVLDKDADMMDNETDKMHNVSNDFKTGSPDYSSNDCCPNQRTDDSFLNGTSLVQSWQFVDDEQSNGLHVSLKTSDCISQSFAHPQNKISSPMVEKVNSHPALSLKEDKCGKPCSMDQENDYLHYRRSVSAILKTSFQHVQAPCFLNRSRASSFAAWKQRLDLPKHCSATSQKMLKSMLFSYRLRNSDTWEVGEENKQIKKSSMFDFDSTCLHHAWSEQRRNEKLNEKFLILRSLVPSLGEVDRVSILNDTIDYLKELERRIQELESCNELIGHETKRQKRCPDVSERTSDNYGNNGNSGGQRPCATKRKACDIGETETELLCLASRDGNSDVSVTITEKEVTVEVHCPWRECLLLEIVDAISNIHLDGHSFQSSTDNGMLSLTIKSKLQGTVLASPRMIKQALHRVLGKC